MIDPNVLQVLLLWIQGGLLLVGLVGTIALIVYTAETRRLRRSSEQQLALLRVQLHLGMIPYLESSLSGFHRGGQEFTESPVSRIRPYWGCKVMNRTDRLAHHIHVAVFDAGAGDCFWSEDGLESIGSKEEEMLTASRVANRDELFRNVTGSYGSEGNTLLQRLAPFQKPILALFFRDLGNRLYLLEREFEQRPNQIWHSLSRLHQSQTVGQ